MPLAAFEKYRRGVSDPYAANGQDISNLRQMADFVKVF
jgi:hypothetical protein